MKHTENRSSRFASQIISAAEKNEQNKVLKLLERKADVNTADKDGNTLLHLACARSNLDIIETLINKNAKTYLVNKNFQRPIQCADKIRVIVTLLSHRANPINPPPYQPEKLFISIWIVFTQSSKNEINLNITANLWPSGVHFRNY